MYGDESNATPGAIRDNREIPSNIDPNIMNHINSNDDTWNQLPLNDTMTGTNKSAKKLNKQLGSSSKKNNSMKNRNQTGKMAYSVGMKG